MMNNRKANETVGGQLAGGKESFSLTPMNPTVSTELLLHIFQAPPEKLAAIKRVLASAACGMGSEELKPGAERLGQFALQRGERAWALIYEGKLAAFADRAGMPLVEYLLKHPHEPIYGLDLLARVSGEGPLQQRSTVLDDRETAREYRRQMDKLKAVIDSGDASGSEKEGAREQLAEFEEYRKELRRQTLDGAAKAARNIRQSLRRLCNSLAEAEDERGGPHPVLRSFAAHLLGHLVARSPDIPPGHLVYQPPAGIVWA
jgi:hypothetical protein